MRFEWEAFVLELRRKECGWVWLCFDNWVGFSCDCASGISSNCKLQRLTIFLGTVQQRNRIWLQ